MRKALLVFFVLVQIGLVRKAKLGYVFVQIGRLKRGNQINPNDQDLERLKKGFGTSLGYFQRIFVFEMSMELKLAMLVFDLAWFKLTIMA